MSRDLGFEARFTLDRRADKHSTGVDVSEMRRLIVLFAASAWLLIGTSMPVQSSAAEGKPLYLRMTIEEADGRGAFQAVTEVLLIHRSPWHEGASVAANELPLNRASAWLDLSQALPNGHGDATCRASVVQGGAAVAGHTKMRIDLARQADASAPLASIVVEDPNGVMGFVVPERGVRDDEIGQRFKSLLDVSKSHLAATNDFGLSREEAPKRFVAATACIVDKRYYTDPRISGNELQTLLRLGFNAFSHTPQNLVEEHRLPYTMSAQYRPAQLADIETQEREAAARGKSNPRTFGRLRIFALSDEPSWDFPQATKRLNLAPKEFAAYPKNINDGKLLPSADNLPKFRQYLREMGFAPGDFGCDTWEQVRPATDALPKEATLPQRRLWYHSVKYVGHEQCQWYGTAAKAFARAEGDVLTFTNWNNPGIFYSDCSKVHDGASWLNGSHEWFEFARAGGGTCLWLAPGMSESGGWYGSTLRTWSLMMNLLRSAAAEGPKQFGAYIHHNFIPEERSYEIELSIMSLAGHGGVAYNSYIWGPHYAFTEYMWSEKLGHYEAVADANRLIGRTENVLLAGRPPRAKVALLWPITSQMYDPNHRGYWSYNRDYLVEMQHVYFALSHRGIPVDFVDDSIIQRGDLARYQVLYVTGPNLERKTATAIVDWVRSGGALWSCAAAGIRDEYDLPQTTLEAALGVTSRQVTRIEADYSPKNGLRELQPLATVQMKPDSGLGDATWNAFGSRSKLRVATGQVLGTFDDGTPAVVQNQLGKGISLHFATMPGLAYSRGATESHGKPTIDYPPRIGDLIALLPKLRGIKPPLTTSLPFVEALWLDSDRGAAITLLNWSGKPLEHVSVKIDNRTGAYRSIRSARLGKVGFEKTNEQLVVDLPMSRVADVLLLEH